MTHRSEDRTRRGSGAADDGKALMVYLNNHLTGATAGARLARRLAEQHRYPGRAGELARVAAEIEEDREALIRLMRETGVPVRRYMVVLGRVGEELSRLKPDGRLVRPSPARAVIDVETMVLGVRGKAALWRALSEVPEQLAEGWPQRLPELLERADEQLETLEGVRREVADEVLVHH